MSDSNHKKLNSSQSQRTMNLSREKVAKRLNFDNVISPLKRPDVIKEENTPEQSKLRSSADKSQPSEMKQDSIFLSPSFHQKLMIPVRATRKNDDLKIKLQSSDESKSVGKSSNQTSFRRAS